MDRTSLSVLIRLVAMMFLQYFVQGSYLPVASVYVQDTLGFSAQQVGYFGMALAIGPILAPFLFGQLVDRMFATERVLAFCHLAGGALLIALYYQTKAPIVIALGALYSVLYVPTMMLTNSLAFHHLKSTAREFPIVRLFGTIGFIVPAWWIELGWLTGLQGEELNARRGMVFLMAGFASLLLGAYCLSLPHTPPEPSKTRDFAPLAVLKAFFTRRNLLVLLVVSLLIGMAHQFYFSWNSPFLRDILRSGRWEEAAEGRIASIGQICEIVVMAGLGMAIARLGFKRVMIGGIAAYMLRCLIFAAVFAFDLPFAARLTLAGAGQALHGFCFGCFLAAAFMYIDGAVGKDLRGSMQTLYGTTILGLGFFVGSYFAGWVGDLFTTTIAASGGEAPLRDSLGIVSRAGMVEFLTKGDIEQLRDWPGIWLSCAVVALAALLIFAIAFPRKAPEDAPA
jgi:nucleoside transporter